MPKPEVKWLLLALLISAVGLATCYIVLVADAYHATLNANDVLMQNCRIQMAQATTAAHDHVAAICLGGVVFFSKVNFAVFFALIIPKLIYFGVLPLLAAWLVGVFLLWAFQRNRLRLEHNTNLIG